MENHTVLRAANGDLIPVADSAAPIKDESGKQLGSIVVFRDVTRQRQLERAKDEFISLASHQLRTPLTSMRLFLEMLLKGQLGKLKKSQRDYLKMIEVSTLRMILIVGNMLNISRIEMGRLKVEPVSTDVNQLILSHCDDVRPLVKEKNLTLEFTPDEKLPLVSIDPILYDQVVHNLLANAIRYTRKGGKIIVKCHNVKEGLRLTIEDNGIGIPEIAIPHISERFFRAANAVHAVGEGTGLGLYLVKLILDSSGGKVSFISKEGKGSTFTVVIPPKGMIARKGDKTLN